MLIFVWYGPNMQVTHREVTVSSVTSRFVVYSLKLMWEVN